MTSIQMKDQDLRAQLDRFLQDPYIKKCVGEAEIPVCFVEMLEELLARDLTSSKDRIYMWAIASILLQMGFEMHARVAIERQLGDMEIKQQQRFVLAGDYYSSLFYRLLANHREIKGIQHFSQVIRSINHDKLSLHMKWLQQQTYDQEMIKNLKSVTSGLLLAVADFFHVQEDFLTSWKQAAELYLFIDYLEKSGEWCHFSVAICRKIEQEWHLLLRRLSQNYSQQDEQRLLVILNQKSDFIRRLSAKEG